MALHDTNCKGIQHFPLTKPLFMAVYDLLLPFGISMLAKFVIRMTTQHKFSINKRESTHDQIQSLTQHVIVVLVTEAVTVGYQNDKHMDQDSFP